MSKRKNGENALETLRNEKVNLVILDVMMPEMDGWEVCKRYVNSHKSL